VGYWRKSDDDDGGSVAQQFDWAQGACPDERIVLVRNFEDQAISGHDTDKRLGFLKALKFCQEEYRKGTPIDVVVCWHSNRFSRADSNETGYYIWSFRKAGVHRIFTSKGWVDFRQMADRIMFNLTQDVANHQFTKDMAQASMRGHLRRAEQGLWNGGPPPYGYRVVDGRLVIDPVAAAIVRELFHAYAELDTSLRALAHGLNARGVPSAKGNQWTGNVIRGILRNRKYLGNLPYGQIVTAKFFSAINLEITERTEDAGKFRRKDEDTIYLKEGTHEAIIRPELFEWVQRKLRARQFRSTPIQGGGDYLLSGLLVCGHCEYSHKGCRRWIEGEWRKVYSCLGYAHYGRSLCNRNQIREDLLLEAIARKLREEFLDPQRLATLRAEVRRQALATRPEDTAQVGQLQAQRDELARKIKLATARLLEEEDTELVPGHREHLQGLHAQKKGIQAQLDLLALSPRQSASEAEAKIDQAMARLNQLFEVFKEGHPARVRAVLGELLARIELYFDHEGHGGRTFSRFAKALIYLHEDFGCSHLVATW
jgi:site-specific DNA recombinase